jgi:hypothetical protein
MFRRTALAAIVATAIAGACTSFESVDAAGGADASIDAATGGADATSGDGGGDGGDGRRFCERQDPKPTFCRDFDDGAPAYFGFSRHKLTDGGSISLDTTDFASPPSSLLLTLPAGPLPLEGSYFSRTQKVDVDLTRAAQFVRFGFHLRVDDADADNPVRTAMLCVPVTGGVYCAYLAIYPAEAKLLEQEPSTNDGGLTTRTHVLGLPLPMGKWTRVEMTLKPGTPEFTITFDGYDANPGAPAFASAAIDMAATFTLGAILYGNASDTIPATKVRYDNVVIDVK